MASFKALCLAGVASFAVTLPVLAADLPLPPPPPIYEQQSAPVGGGWYLRGDVGAGIEQLTSPQAHFQDPAGYYAGTGGYPGGFAFGDRSIDAQAILGLGAGYQINNYFRADVTGEYRTDAKLRSIETYTAFCGIGTCYDGYNSSAHSAVFLVNGYVDVGTWYGVTPYVGAGIGTAINTFATLTDNSYSTSGFGSSSGPHTSVGLAYAVMAGFSYALTPNLKLDLGYRYLDMGTIRSNAVNCNGGIAAGCAYEVQKFRLTSNDIRLGLRYQFADYVPYAQHPVIARY